MKKIRICLIGMLCAVFCLCATSEGASVGASVKKETRLSQKGEEYKAYQIELENYLLQSEMKKADMEKAFQSYTASMNEVSFEVFKEAELAYKKSCFYENNGAAWLKEQWQREDGTFQLQIASYWLLRSECDYVKVQLRKWQSMYREALQKRKKGLITQSDEKEVLCQLRNIREQLKRKEKKVSAQEREIRSRSGEKNIGRAALKSKTVGKKAATKYLSLWKKNKTGYRQFLFEISVYNEYLEGLRSDVLNQNIRVKYVENEVRLLTIQKKLYIEGMRKKIRDKIGDYQEAKVSWKAKERELAVAKEKMKQVRLLKKKGQTVESGVQKQREEVARLVYEKAVCRCQMDEKLIELEYGLEDS